jgi:hypothetical protein
MRPSRNLCNCNKRIPLCEHIAVGGAGLVPNATHPSEAPQPSNYLEFEPEADLAFAAGEDLQHLGEFGSGRAGT